MDFDKIVIVTQKTWLEGLIEKFGTTSQAKFYLEQNNLSFTQYETQHIVYYQAVQALKNKIPVDLRMQVIERNFLPNFLFNPKDLIVVIGRDGLVVNTAKYLDTQLILAVNPDPATVEGVLLPFEVKNVPEVLAQIQAGKEHIVNITMAKAELQNHQMLYAVNDLFIGHKSHQSARYAISIQQQKEVQSSSGIIISTGAGSTGWFKSIITGAMGISAAVQQEGITPITQNIYRFPWDSPYLCYSVREPWISKTSGANLMFGKIYTKDILTIESHMPEGGVIFSDGIETDYLPFTSGTIAQIRVAEKQAHLVLYPSR